MKNIIFLTLFLSFFLTQTTQAQDLIASIQKGNDKNVNKAVNQKSNKINTEQEKETGDYAIHVAVLSDRADYVKLLIDNNADVNVQNNRNNTPLLISIADNQFEIFKLLLDANPDINIQNFNNNTPLIVAAKNNQIDYVKVILNKNPLISEQNILGKTALMYAVEKDNFSIVKMLYDKNADVNIKDNINKNALDYISSDEIRWYIGTEEYLKEYVIDIKTLKKYKTKFPQSKNLSYLSENILKNSKNIDEVLEIDNFKILNETEIEQKAIEVVFNYKDAQKFKKRFIKSKNNKQVVINALQESYSSDIFQLSELYSEDFYMDSTDFSNLIVNDYKRSKYMNALFVLNPSLTLDDIDIFFNKYKWLNFDNRKQIILENYWNISSELLNFGDAVIEIMYSLNQKDGWDISENDVDIFISQKLKIEAKKNVRIISTNSLGSNNSEWDNWCANDTYTAGLVQDEGDIKYIVYGKIENNSIFNLPVKITASGDIYKHEQISGTGFFTNLAVGFMSMLGMKTESKSKIGTQNQVFYIPKLTPEDDGLYSVLLDYGDGVRRSGTNFNDWFKFTSTIEIQNIDSYYNYFEHKLSKHEIDQQYEWMKLAENGFPDAKLYDIWRGTEVKDSVWQDKWQKILIERAKMAAKMEKMKQETYRSVQIISGDENDFKIIKTGESSYCHVEIHDGALFGADVCEDYYFVSYSDKYKNESFNSTHGDSNDDTRYYPLKVSITYKSYCSGDTKSIVLIITEGGYYNIDIY